MKRVTLIAAAFVVAVLAMLTTRVAAQDTNVHERTFMTFSNTVEMPGVTLPAGTYVFRLADTPSRNVVQVLTKDEKDIMGQWTFVQTQRNKVSDETVVMFKENREGSTPAVQYWYYPGESIGKEFIYPKEQAQKIAARTGQSVLSDDGRIEGVTREQVAEANRAADTQVAAQATAPEPDRSFGPDSDRTSNRNNDNLVARDNDADKAALSAQANTSNDNRAIGTSGDVAPQSSDRPVAESTQARAELPRTASPAPLVGLIGLLSLAAALGTRKLAAARQ